METEVDKLFARHEAEGVVNFHVDLAPGFNGTAEDVARELNRVDAWLKVPKNNLISRLGGQEMLCSDYEHEGTNVITGEKVPLTYQEKHFGEIAKLLRETIKFIEENC